MSIAVDALPSELELVTDTVNRPDQLLLRARRVEFAAQVLDVAVDGAVGDDAVIGVQVVEQLVA